MKTVRPAPKGAFVGKVTGSRAYVALVSDGRQVSGYVCDGEKVSRWLRPAAIDDDTATLRGRDGSVLGSVRRDGGRASGASATATHVTSFTSNETDF